MVEKVEFTGQVSKLFEEFDEGNFENLKHLKIIKEYGEFGQSESGESLAYFLWDGGDRKLAEYEEDGSLFLVQTSEIHRTEDVDEERDWYQVESKEQAEWINSHLNGHRLSLNYHGPKIWTQEGTIHYRENFGAHKK